VPLTDRDEYNAYMAEYMLKRYHERRQYALDLLGSVCSTCGTDEDLNFDHIDQDTKLFPISKLWSVSRKRFEEEIRKCQVLCQPCHIEKSKMNQDYTRKGKRPNHNQYTRTPS